MVVMTLGPLGVPLTLEKPQHGSRDMGLEKDSAINLT